MKIIHLAAPILSVALTVPTLGLRAQQNDPQQNTQQQQQNPPQQQYNNPQQQNPSQQQQYNPQQQNAQQQQQYPQQQQPYNSQQQNGQQQQPYGNQQQPYGNQQQPYGNQQQPYGNQQQRQDDARGAGQWDAPPANYSDVGRRGFQDGVEAARNDFANRADMNPHRSPMYRHPPVEHHSRDEYRNSFMHGYNMSMQHTGITHQQRHDDDDHR